MEFGKDPNAVTGDPRFNGKKPREEAGAFVNIMMKAVSKSGEVKLGEFGIALRPSVKAEAQIIEWKKKAVAAGPEAEDEFNAWFSTQISATVRLNEKSGGVELDTSAMEMPAFLQAK
jgi:hypothetical protein